VVKICGLTRQEDVTLACECGAWAVGFIFAPSRRRLTPRAARDLVEVVRATRPGVARPRAIGVFGDVPAAEIAQVVEEVGLDGVQLHSPNGPGGAAVRAALGGRAGAVLVIQVVPVAPGLGCGADHEAGNETSVLREKVAQARSQADIVLLDTQAAGGLGGSGTTFPWHLVSAADDGGPLLIAGGITPANANAALRQSGAWGVDVSSGVEISPGVKDPRLVRQLFECVSASRETRTATTGRMEK